MLENLESFKNIKYGNVNVRSNIIEFHYCVITLLRIDNLLYLNFTTQVEKFVSIGEDAPYWFIFRHFFPLMKKNVFLLSG